MKILEVNPTTPDALLIMNELSVELESITGDSGEGSDKEGLGGRTNMECVSICCR